MTERRPNTDLSMGGSLPRKKQNTELLNLRIDRPRRQAASPIEKALHICQSSEMVHEDDFEVKFINRYKEGESESSSESEVVVQKEGQRKRRKWSSQERKAIEEHVLPTVKVEQKPPKKITVDKARQRCTLLHKFCWKSIKYQAWSMYQQYKKKNLSVAKALLDGH